MSSKSAEKKRKAAAAVPAADGPGVSERTASVNIIAQLQSSDGQVIGPQLDLPSGVTPIQLEELLNGLLKAEERTPYAFYVGDIEINGELAAFLSERAISVEGVLRITYQPQALFRVRPVTRCSSAMEGHSEAILCTSFSPDGQHLASGSGDTTVRFYNLNIELPAAVGKGHKNWVLVVAWSPDGALLASGGMDAEVRLWQPNTGNVSVALFKGHKKGITSLAWEPAHIALPCARVASGSRDGTIRIWDTARKLCQLHLTSHTKEVTAIKWGGDGLLYSASRDTSILVWETQEGKLIRSLKGHGHWVNSLALSSEYALRTGAFDHTGTAPKDIQEAKAAALARYEEAKGGQPERLVSGSDDYTLFLWNPAEAKAPIARMTGHMQLINHVAFSPNGRLVASGSFDKSVKLWNGLTGQFMSSLRAHVGPVYMVAWSSDSRMLVSSSKDSTLKLWEVRSQKMKLDLPGHADEVYAVDWSPRGGHVASGGKDRTLRLWRQ